MAYDSKSFGFVYSYLSLVNLSKKDIGIAINEMYRVLMKGGLCYVNVLSKDDSNFDEREETNPGEVPCKHGDQEFVHSYFEDEEPDDYFNKFEILYKEKRKILQGKYFDTGRTCVLDYIVKK